MTDYSKLKELASTLLRELQSAQLAHKTLETMAAEAALEQEPELAPQPAAQPRPTKPSR